MLKQNNGKIFQIEGEKLDKYDFLDYLKGKYPTIRKKYLMIEIGSVKVSNTLLDSVFINMVQTAAFAGYNYIMVMV